MADFTKYRTYSIRIEPFNDQLALYYWQYGYGRVKAYIYRAITTSYYQMALDFVTTYPQYEIDFALHGWSVPNSSVASPPNSESVVPLHFTTPYHNQGGYYIYNFYFDLDMNLLTIDTSSTRTTYGLKMLQSFEGSSIDLSAYGDDFFSPIRRIPLPVYDTSNPYYELRIYNYVCVLYLTFTAVDFRYVCYVYEKYKKKTTCCIDLCCYPNDYILI